ncbi:MAG: VCBS repeat-containing protein [Desulfobacterales bacterium]|nr:MAG: VCBS repeat-containing protein [Desulfobacterales bacterium]
MKMHHIIEQAKKRKSIPLLKNGLLFAGCVALIAFGCAQDKRYENPVIKSKSDGLASAGNFYAVAVEDLDNDGYLDVVGGASTPGMVTINYGDGRGGISEPQILPVKGDVRSVAVADFNEDGLNDIVFTLQRETSGIRVWINQSDRKWKNTKGPIEINTYQSVKTGDVNGDGHFDIIAANSTSETQAGIQIWLGDGKGGWLKESGPTVTGKYMDVALADFNGDRKLDLVGAGWGTYGALRVWLGDGAGHWSAAYQISQGSFYGIKIGDVDADENLDILVGAYRANTKIFLGDGKGRFQRIKSPADHLKRRVQAQPQTYKAVEKEYTRIAGDSFWTALPVDLDGDGAVDLVASSINQRGILAWQNLGKNLWKLVEGQFPSTGTYYEMVLADLNNDGSPEICAASSGEGIKIWQGKPDASLTPKNMDIEQIADKNRLAVLEAPLENNVFATVNGRAEYKIGPGDVLEITSWKGNEPKKEEILVRQDGKISFGFVEDLPIDGLTPSQLDDRLTKKIGEYVRKPRIDVVVKEYNSKVVTLLGAIIYKGYAGTGPGKYKLSGKTTLLEVLTQAGGPSKDADLKNISIRRKNGRSISLDLFAAIHKGDPEQDFIIDDGDVVFVPTFDKKGNRIYVFGEVEKPGAYEYISSEMRLFDAIAEAGGATAFAATRNTKVVRGDPTRPEIISTNLDRLIEEGDQSQNIILASGDLVYVPRSGFGEINLFAKRIRPLLELLIWPARVVKDWDDAVDVVKSND